jgi:hypothetical protein
MTARRSGAQLDLGAVQLVHVERRRVILLDGHERHPSR